MCIHVTANLRKTKTYKHRSDFLAWTVSIKSSSIIRHQGHLIGSNQLSHQAVDSASAIL